MTVQRELAELHRLAHDRDIRSETNITITFPLKAPVIFFQDLLVCIRQQQLKLVEMCKKTFT